MGSPNSSIAAGAARGSSPEIAASSSCWPLPDTPAMPTISPCRTSSETPSRATLNRSKLGRWRSRTASASAPSFAGFFSSRGGSAPIIIRERLAVVSWAGSQVPTTWPPRRTVHRWQSARISSSLWLM